MSNDDDITPVADRRCTLCGDPTRMICADCFMDGKAERLCAVCDNPACRDEHEKKHCTRPKGPTLKLL